MIYADDVRKLFNVRHYRVRIYSHPSPSTETGSASWSSSSQNLGTRLFKPLGHDKASTIPGDLLKKAEYLMVPR